MESKALALETTFVGQRNLESKALALDLLTFVGQRDMESKALALDLLTFVGHVVR
jgi:hypothetical protein